MTDEQLASIGAAVPAGSDYTARRDRAIADYQAGTIAELITALEDLRSQLRGHIRFDVKKHYSLMVADVAAAKAIEKAKP